MKLCTFTQNNKSEIGLMSGNEIVPVSRIYSDLPERMEQLLERMNDFRDRLQNAAQQSTERLALGDVHLEAPVMNPRKFLALGLNYPAHVKEAAERSESMKGVGIPTSQIWFNKQVTSVNGPYDPVWSPPSGVAKLLDYEAELAVVIGKRCRHVSKEDALSVIGGYTVCNDVSVRDWQRHSKTMTMGKSFDTHGPFGPWIVTPDELGDYRDVQLRALVNGEVRQDFRAGDMIFKIEEMIAYLSTAFTLEPGDVLATGTSAGVGVLMDPPQSLVPGDVVRIEASGIGYIENEIIPEPENAIRIF